MTEFQWFSYKIFIFQKSLIINFQWCGCFVLTHIYLEAKMLCSYNRKNDLSVVVNILSFGTIYNNQFWRVLALKESGWIFNPSTSQGNHAGHGLYMTKTNRHCFSLGSCPSQKQKPWHNNNECFFADPHSLWNYNKYTETSTVTHTPTTIIFCLKVF